MKNKEILEIAVKQSAEDIGCKPEDFFRIQILLFRLDWEKMQKSIISCLWDAILYLTGIMWLRLQETNCLKLYKST